jgi:NMD protein affecting ribosome stability and mRNA decay
MSTLQFTQQLETTSCARCGIVFAVPEWFNQDRRETHKTFYCPNGHSLTYTAKSEAELERERRIRAEARAARFEDKAEVLERRRRAEKAAKTRVLNRIKNGVCPHCRRTFADLARHMQSKHADVEATADA